MMLKRTFAVTGLIAVALATSPTAAAQSDDENFLDSLQDQGISYSSAEQAVDDAHEVCDWVDLGFSGSDVASEISDDGGVVSDAAATAFVAVAIAAYCPRNIDEI